MTLLCDSFGDQNTTTRAQTQLLLAPIHNFLAQPIFCLESHFDSDSSSMTMGRGFIEYTGLYLCFLLGGLRPIVIRGNTSHWESTLALCSLSLPPKALYIPYMNIGTWRYKCRVVSHGHPYVPFDEDDCFQKVCRCFHREFAGVSGSLPSFSSSSRLIILRLG